MINYQLILDCIKELPQKEPRKPTLLEIAGNPHRENRINNLLAFYFDSRKNDHHGLDDLFIRSLLESVGSADFNYSKSAILNISTEFVTAQKNRIDIVIELEDHVVAIENKIFHSANNPFDDYQNFLEKRFTDKPKTFVLLGLRKVSLPSSNEFKSISYDDFFTKLKTNLTKEAYSKNGSPYHISFVNELILTISNLVRHQTMDKKDLEFLNNNSVEIRQVAGLLNEFFEKVKKRLDELQKSLSKDPRVDEFSRFKTEYLHQIMECKIKGIEGCNGVVLKVRYKLNGISAGLFKTADLPLHIREKIGGDFASAKGNRSDERVTFLQWGTDNMMDKSKVEDLHDEIIKLLNTISN